MIGSWEVQKALLDVLVAAGVAGGRIYDAVPPNAETPYVEIGETQPIKADVQCRGGVDEFVTLHIWDRPKSSGGQRGQKNIKLIGAAVEAALHAKGIDVMGRDSAFVTVRDLRTLDDPDGLTQHGVLTLRIQHFGPKET